MNKKDAIKQEIDKTKDRLNKLELLLKNVNGSTLEICPICKTKNYHYVIDTNSWCCAFC